MTCDLCGNASNGRLCAGCLSWDFRDDSLDDDEELHDCTGCDHVGVTVPDSITTGM